MKKSTNEIIYHHLSLPIDNDNIAIVGLVWRSFAPTKNKRASRSTINKLLRRTGHEYFVINQKDDNIQCGMASDIPKKNCYSLALLLIQSLGDDWIAVFEHSHKYIFIAVEKGLVVPGCDLLLHSKTEVIETFNHYYTLFNWETIYTPSNLNLGGKELELNAFLDSNKLQTSPKLQYFYGSQKNIRWLIVYATLLLSVVTYLFFYAHTIYKNWSARKKAINAAPLRPTTIKKIVKLDPWMKKPPADVLLERCVEAISAYPLVLGGWRVVSVQCTAKGAKATYQVTAPYTSIEFIQAAEQRFNKDYEVISEQYAIVHQPISINSQRTQEKLGPIVEVTDKLKSILTSNVAKGSISNSSTTMQASVKFNITSSFSPKMILQNIPWNAVVIDTVNITVSAVGNITWSITGKAYGQ